MLWIKWHWMELLAVTVAVTAGVTVSRWWLIPAAAIVVVWVRGEWANRQPPSSPAAEAEEPVRDEASA